MAVTINGTSGITTPAQTVQGPLVIDSLVNDQFRLTSGGAQNLYMDTDNNGVALGGGPGQTLGGVYLYNSIGAVSLFTGNNLRLTVDSSGRVTMPYQPAFEAYNISDTTFNGTNQSATVVYNATYRNTGSHYNTSTGVFTAPVAGYYAFFAGGYINNTSLTQIWAIQNGARTVSLCVKPVTGTPGDTISGSAIVYMAANDTFGVFLYSATAGNPTTLFSNPYHTFFKGYFLG